MGWPLRRVPGGEGGRVGVVVVVAGGGATGVIAAAAGTAGG